MGLKTLLIALLIVTLILGGTWIYVKQTQQNATAEIISPFANKLVAAVDELKTPIQPKPNSELANNDIINILLLGIDRRSREETAYRTDIMISLIVNKKTNKVAMVSVPRDLWYHSGRINAVYVAEDFIGMQDAFEKFTGIRPQKFVLTDFADFSWIVDSMGGVPVTVETSFTDTQYPVDATHGYQTINFIQGPTVLTGEKALIYARSRKGNNGEGSDWMRMKRQHLILKGMLQAVVQPQSLFNPMNVEKALTMVTTNKMDTNLQLDDAKYLWDFYKDKDKYEIQSFFLDGDYVFNPPMENYGGAWVLDEQPDGFTKFSKELSDYLNNIPQPLPTTESNQEEVHNN